VHVGEDTTGSDGHVAEKDVELLVVADSKLEVAGDDAAALVVAGGVAGELKDLSAQVLQDGSKVHGSARSEAGGKVLLAHVAGDTADRELESSAGRAAGALSLGAAASLSLSFSFARHFEELFEVWRLKKCFLIPAAEKQVFEKAPGWAGRASRCIPSLRPALLHHSSIGSALRIPGAG